MSASQYILAINPGSTSTRLALFKNSQWLELWYGANIQHSTAELARFTHISDQYQFRLQSVESFLAHNGEPQLAAVVGRGGLLKPIPSGTYLVDEAMVADLQKGIRGEHASNLGGLLAKGIADSRQVPAFVVDPVSVDEFTPLARISGLPQIPRLSLGHALNIRAVARRVATSMGRELIDTNFVVAHLGGGISIAPVQGGRILDYNDANQGGPFSPERAGSLPAGEIVKLAFSGRYTISQLGKLLNGQSGLVGYLGSNDARAAVARAKQGDASARLVLEAMVFQIAKEIGAMATVLWGQVDAIILTGGLAHSTYLTERIADFVSYIAPVRIVPGEYEMRALAEGAWRVLSGQQQAASYKEADCHA
ncbi:MAG: butyrate kinase [Firmicutes bacterium]|nr:butyrate kinase [Bacillota bacterium]